VSIRTFTRTAAGALILLAGGCTYDFDAYSPVAAAPADAATQNDAAPTGCSEPGAKPALGRCYFPTATPQAWSDARKACESVGAYLATIATVEEQLAVSAVGAGDRWIGLSRPDGSPNTSESFRWTTGEAVTFTRWSGGKPTGAGTCVQLDASGVWRDRACGDALLSICER